MRTGKSYLLNKLVTLFKPDAKITKLFKTAKDTKSCTQGIWLWGEPIYIQEKDMYLILIDCEGHGSPD